MASLGHWLFELEVVSSPQAAFSNEECVADPEPPFIHSFLIFSICLFIHTVICVYIVILK